MQLPEAIAVIIMASQKSAPVALTVISYITKDAAMQGVLALPSITGQLAQVFIGSLLAKLMAQRVRAWKRQQTTAQ